MGAAGISELVFIIVNLARGTLGVYKGLLPYLLVSSIVLFFLTFMVIIFGIRKTKNK